MLVGVTSRAFSRWTRSLLSLPSVTMLKPAFHTSIEKMMCLKSIVPLYLSHQAISTHDPEAADEATGILQLAVDQTKPSGLEVNTKPAPVMRRWRVSGKGIRFFSRECPRRKRTGPRLDAPLPSLSFRRILRVSFVLEVDMLRDRSHPMNVGIHWHHFRGSWLKEPYYRGPTNLHLLIASGSGSGLLL